jgi:hypothetical protein
VGRALVAVGVGMALADASVVTLALPELIVDLDTNVEGVAAVLGVYTAVLAVAMLPAEWLRRRIGTPWLGATGFVLFAVAGGACGAVESLEPLLVLRGTQAVGAAAGLVCGFALLSTGEHGRERLWTGAAVIGAAAGPALGGLLTELFDWRAIFLVQAPIGVLAAAPFALPGAARSALAAHDSDARSPSALEEIELGPAAALALVSAALVAVLFLLVLLLVSGWSIPPLEAALAVSILPAAALIGTRIGGPPGTRAAAGCALVGAGVLGLAVPGSASIAWTVVPQLLAGVGMGLALTALIGPLLPERTPAQTALLLAIRHGGITLALLVLAPVAASQVDSAVEDTRERGAALVLDAELPPLDKLDLAAAVTGNLDPVDPRGTLQSSLQGAAASVGDDPQGQAVYAELTRRADETLVAAVDRAFAPAFAIAAALALIGAVALVPRLDRRARAVSAGVTGCALALSAAQVAVAVATRPDPVRIADPCEPRELPSTGGLGGIAQDAGLAGLDRAACEFGSSREELAIALVDDGAAEAYEDEYGVDPRSLGSLLGGVLGL